MFRYPHCYFNISFCQCLGFPRVPHVLTFKLKHIAADSLFSVNVEEFRGFLIFSSFIDKQSPENFSFSANFDDFCGFLDLRFFFAISFRDSAEIVGFVRMPGFPHFYFEIGFLELLRIPYFPRLYFEIPSLKFFVSADFHEFFIFRVLFWNIYPRIPLFWRILSISNFPYFYFKYPLAEFPFCADS